MSRRDAKLIVYGTGRSQGSKRHVGGGRMVEQVKGLPGWRADVARAAGEYARHQPGWALLEGALGMVVTFYRIRPKSAKNRAYPHTAPDSSKLLRAIEDAMEGILYRNDAQFCDTRVLKEFGEPARAVISIWEME